MVVEQGSEGVKYYTEISQAQGAAIGDGARAYHIEQHFDLAPAPSSPSRDELLNAVRHASAELRAYPSDIADIHIDRAEVAEIVQWVMGANPQERVGMLQDRPGGGKSVVMHDVLGRLEAHGVPVLAIKADALSSVKSRNDLAARLGLPVPVEECVRGLASEGQCAVLLDQLDALSLALSRDQATLDVMLGAIAHLRDVEGVRILASCRAFELHNDPRLSTIKVDREFQLHPLDGSQVKQVLQAIDIDPARLLPEHQSLLTVPLHLKVYVQVVTGRTLKGTPECFRTLQELYEALWRNKIITTPPDTLPPSTCSAAIYRLVDTMQANRQLTAPVAVLDEWAEAARYLEQEGFVRQELGNWLFSHQTLFDYCYARRFVAQNKSLSQEILSGPQGLFERSQIVQILAYLRDADQAAYRRELTDLLFADGLRVHLRFLLIDWLGSLPNPTDDELQVACQLMCRADDGIRFLQAARGNEGWFDRLNEGVLRPLLRCDDERVIESAVSHLGTVIRSRTSAVLAHLRPYLGTSEQWDDRIAFCLSRLDQWRSDEALNILCDLFRRGCASSLGDLCLHALAYSNPAAGCQALRAYLDRRLDALLAQERVDSPTTGDNPETVHQASRLDRFKWEQQLLGEYAIGEVMGAAIHTCPEAIVEHLLPWFVRASLTLAPPQDDQDDRKAYYSSDVLFCWGWYDEHVASGANFARCMAEAVGRLAQANPAEFRTTAAQLTSVESLAIQHVLAHAYLSSPEVYGGDIFEYLMGDPRRLNIGEMLEDSRYDSCRLYGAAFRFVDADRRIALEQLILNLTPTWESFRYRGITQLRFLKSVPWQLLSPTAQDRLGELERKFPDFELRPPVGVQFVQVGPPIEAAAQAKMSDEDWLGAMREYDDSTAWGGPREGFLEGGVVELSRAFVEQVKADPERFYRLAQHFDETISLHYVAASISGLADADAPAEWVFDLVRRFASRVEGEFRRSVCRALEKRAEVGVPDDLLELMTDWALNDPDPTEELWRAPASGGTPYYGGDPFEHGINTNRGTAVWTVCHCAVKRKPPQVERAFHLLEQAAQDPSTAVRACVIERLGPLLGYDDHRALAVFGRALEGHDQLLQSHLVHRFLYWTYYSHFYQTRHWIEALLANPDDATRQAGARLVCLAAFRYPEAMVLARQVAGCPSHRPKEEFKRSLLVTIRRLQFHARRFFSVPRGRFLRNDAWMRQGAAQVYARNLEHPDLEDVCRKGLLQLMNDPDDRVRSEVGTCFTYLRNEHLERLRPFLEQLLVSPALMNGAKYLVKYLAPLAVDVPDLALKVTERILDAAGGDVTDVRTAASILEPDLARLPLTVYTHASDPAEKSRAMDLFERLLLLGSRSAHEALADWDRR